MRAFIAILLSATVYLSGCASTISAVKEEPIQEDQGNRTWGAWLDDQNIETVSLVNLDKANPAFKNNRVNVSSYNGYVLLSGQVTTPELKSEAEAVVRKVLKIRKIFNELEISGPTTAFVRSSDTWLSAKIRSRMLATEKFPSSRIKIVTENGTVYLMGLVTTAQANEAVKLAKESYGVQKIVKVFEYIR